MKKRIIVGVSVFMILVSGIRVYESQEQMKLKEIRTENHVDKTSNTPSPNSSIDTSKVPPPKS